MRRRRDQDHPPLIITAALVIGMDRQQAGELALAAGVGLQAHRVVPGDRGEPALEVGDDVEQARRVLPRGERVQLGELRPATGASKAELMGRIVMCPPGALNDRWSRRLPDPITAMASGWMRIRQRARQKNVELPLIISDHADWDELIDTIREVRPQEVWITHGREDALMHWCMLHQIKARELNLVGYEDDEEDG